MRLLPKFLKLALITFLELKQTRLAAIWFTFNRIQRLEYMHEHFSRVAFPKISYRIIVKRLMEKVYALIRILG